MSTFLNVGEIQTSKHKSAQFATLSLYFSDKNKIGHQVYASTKCKLYLLIGFRANIMVGNNILFLEDFVININKNCAFTESCGATIPINVRQRDKFFTITFLASNNNLVPPSSKTMILFALVFQPDNYNFSFHTTIQANLTIYIYIVDHTTTKILVKNISNYPLCIPRYQKLRQLINICYKNCCLADTKTTFNLSVFLLRVQLFFNLHVRVLLAPTDTLIEMQLENGIRIYKDKVVVKEISELVAQYPSIWGI